MTTAQPRILKVARAGKDLRWYIYAWRGGPLIRVATQPARPKLTHDDFAAISKAHEADRTLPTDTVAGAVTAFRKTKYWRSDLSDGTRRVWGTALDRIEAKWPKVPMHVIGDLRFKPKVAKWRDAIAETAPRAADIAVTVLAKFMEWAVLNGLAQANPAAGVPTVYRRTDRAPVIWLAEDIAALDAVAERPLRDATALAELTGLRRADLVALRWDEVGDFAISRTAAKRSRGKRYRVTIPRLPALDKLLEDLRARPRKAGVETVLVNSYGKAWTGDGLGTSFHEARAKANNGAGIHHEERDPVTGEIAKLAKRLHDFRGTFVTHLMTHPTAKLTDKEIADLLGWDEKQINEIRKRYVDGAAIVVAIGRRLARGNGKRLGKRRA
jgi:integrase